MARELKPETTQETDAADALVIADFMRRLQNPDAPLTEAHETAQAAPASPRHDEARPAPARAEPRSRPLRRPRLRPRRRSTRFFASATAKRHRIRPYQGVRGE